ncbi:gamma-glutamyl transpeptidase [Loa loa]|uniref:Gamma-glutamyl transpeptidase n=1 Tax=Loa loa TaxID=7209 RepID=A0A1I7W4K5_LOALO|nr:gamma-glutamyl transpeptidase [Loa loa]EFO17722.1 gamma-glutamyl transpeptidase [Loa loa]
MGKYTSAAVTCDHGLCSEIGRNILIRGGNAVDASIASMFCLGVTNPQSSGIGGGFIMTLYNRTEKKCTVIDARETAPNNAKRDMFINDEFGSKYATPGEIAGYWLVFQRYGSGKISWYDLIKPSIDMCRYGVPISKYLGYVLGVKEKHFRTLPSMKDWINRSTGKVFVAGDIIKRPELGNTLERLALSPDPVELFYRGDIAKKLVKEIQDNGGIITASDFAQFKPTVHEQPLINDHFSGDLAMCGPPPPSSFAVTQLIISLMARFYGPKTKKEVLRHDPLFYHRLLEAQKFAYAQRTLMGDEAFVKEAKELAKNMTTKEYTDWVFSRMRNVTQPTEYYGGFREQFNDHGTSHVSVLDSMGNAVSGTSTVNRWFGAVVQSVELGVIFNDEMDDFSTPGMANGFGFAPSERNFIEPKKKPMSSMSPMIVYNNKTGKVVMVAGASGGSKIISALAKPVIRVLFFNETIKEAIDAPTLHNQFTPDVTQFEHTVPKELMNDLTEIFGQRFKETTGFEGIAQGIVVGDDGTISANGDYRRQSDMHPGGY